MANIRLVESWLPADLKMINKTQKWNDEQLNGNLIFLFVLKIWSNPKSIEWQIKFNEIIDNAHRNVVLGTRSLNMEFVFSSSLNVNQIKVLFGECGWKSNCFVHSFIHWNKLLNWIKEKTLKPSKRKNKWMNEWMNEIGHYMDTLDRIISDYYYYY